ncbi:MAG: hypothetical protein HY582_05410, partial [Candidatus Omnitrophica bacterium]|nr:hypothetical protein [Candidatus Omnitrophota bacterium]
DNHRAELRANDENRNVAEIGDEIIKRVIEDLEMQGIQEPSEIRKRLEVFGIIFWEELVDQFLILEYQRRARDPKFAKVIYPNDVREFRGAPSGFRDPSRGSVDRKRFFDPFSFTFFGYVELSDVTQSLARILYRQSSIRALFEELPNPERTMLATRPTGGITIRSRPIVSFWQWMRRTQLGDGVTMYAHASRSPLTQLLQDIEKGVLKDNKIDRASAFKVLLTPEGHEEIVDQLKDDKPWDWHDVSLPLGDRVVLDAFAVPTWARSFEPLSEPEAVALFAIANQTGAVFFNQRPNIQLGQGEIDRFFQSLSSVSSIAEANALFGAWMENYLQLAWSSLRDIQKDERASELLTWLQAFYTLENKVLYAKGLAPLVVLERLRLTDDGPQYAVRLKDLYRIYFGIHQLFDEDSTGLEIEGDALFQTGSLEGQALLMKLQDRTPVEIPEVGSSEDSPPTLKLLRMKDVIQLEALNLTRWVHVTRIIKPVKTGLVPGIIPLGKVLSPYTEVTDRIQLAPDLTNGEKRNVVDALNIFHRLNPGFFTKLRERKITISIVKTSGEELGRKIQRQSGDPSKIPDFSNSGGGLLFGKRSSQGVEMLLFIDPVLVTSFAMTLSVVGFNLIVSDEISSQPLSEVKVDGSEMEVGHVPMIDQPKVSAKTRVFLEAVLEHPELSKTDRVQKAASVLRPLINGLVVDAGEPNSDSDSSREGSTSAPLRNLMIESLRFHRDIESGVPAPTERYKQIERAHLELIRRGMETLDTILELLEEIDGPLKEFDFDDVGFIFSSIAFYVVVQSGMDHPISLAKKAQQIIGKVSTFQLSDKVREQIQSLSHVINQLAEGRALDDADYDENVPLGRFDSSNPDFVLAYSIAQQIVAQDPSIDASKIISGLVNSGSLPPVVRKAFHDHDLPTDIRSLTQQGPRFKHLIGLITAIIESRRSELRSRNVPSKSSFQSNRRFQMDKAEAKQVLEWIEGGGKLSADQPRLAIVVPRVSTKSHGAILVNLFPTSSKFPWTRSYGLNQAITKLLIHEVSYQYGKVNLPVPKLLYWYIERSNGEKRIRVYKIPDGSTVNLDNRFDLFKQVSSQPDAYLGDIKLNITRDKNAVQSVRFQIETTIHLFLSESFNLVEKWNPAAFVGQEMISLSPHRRKQFWDALEGYDFEVVSLLKRRLERLAEKSQWTHILLSRSYHKDRYGRQYFLIRGTLVKEMGHVILNESPLQFVILIDTTHPDWISGSRFVYRPTIGLWALGVIDANDIVRKERLINVRFNRLGKLLLPKELATMKNLGNRVFGRIDIVATGVHSLISDQKLPGFRLPLKTATRGSVIIDNELYRQERSERWPLEFAEDPVMGVKRVGIRKPGNQPWKPVVWIVASNQNRLVGDVKKVTHWFLQSQRTWLREVNRRYFQNEAMEPDEEPWVQVMVQPSPLRPNGHLEWRMGPADILTFMPGFPSMGALEMIPGFRKTRLILRPPNAEIKTKRRFLRAIDGESRVLFYLFVDDDGHTRLRVNELPETLADRDELITDILLAKGLRELEARRLNSTVSKLLGVSESYLLGLSQSFAPSPDLFERILEVDPTLLEKGEPALIIPPSQYGQFKIEDFTLVTPQGFKNISANEWHASYESDPARSELRQKTVASGQLLTSSKPLNQSVQLEPSDQQLDTQNKSELRGKGHDTTWHFTWINPTRLTYDFEIIHGVLEILAGKVNRNELLELFDFTPLIELVQRYRERAVVINYLVTQVRSLGDDAYDTFRDALQAAKNPSNILAIVERAQERKQLISYRIPFPPNPNGFSFPRARVFSDKIGDLEEITFTETNGVYLAIQRQDGYFTIVRRGPGLTDKPVHLSRETPVVLIQPNGKGVMDGAGVLSGSEYGLRPFEEIKLELIYGTFKSAQDPSVKVQKPMVKVVVEAEIGLSFKIRLPETHFVGPEFSKFRAELRSRGEELGREETANTANFDDLDSALTLTNEQIMPYQKATRELV